MPWVDAEVVVSLEVMVDLLCTTCGRLPSFEPSCERFLCSFQCRLWYMRLQVGKWPEIPKYF